MEKKKYTFSQKSTNYYFNADIGYLEKLVDISHAVIITDENIFRVHGKKLKGWKTIVLKPGEQFKVQATVDDVIRQLIAHKADRNLFSLESVVV